MELFSSDELTKRSKAIFNNLGCNYENTTDKNIFSQCVQSLNSQSILIETDNYSNSVILNGKPLASELNPTFQLVLDGIEFKETIKNSIKKNRFKQVNILAGYTSG